MTFGDFLRLVRRLISFGASNFMAGLFIWVWYTRGCLDGQTLGSIIFGFACILTALYDWWRAISCPLYKFVVEAHKYYKLKKSGELDFVVE